MARMRHTVFVSCVILLLASSGDLGGEAAPLAQRPYYRVYGDTFTRAGKTVTMDCELDGFPPFKSRPPSYQWLKDGEVIPGQSSSTLALHSVTRQDTGNYQCGPSGSDVDRKGLDLHVFVPGDVVPRPEIIKQQDSLAVCGRPYSLRCMFHRNVPYIVSRDTVFTWYKDSAEVKGQSGEVLTLHNVTEADGGLYMCTAREGPVESTSPPSSDYDLTVFVPPHLRIKPSGPVVKGILGESLTLTCVVTRASPNVPADGYSWSYLPLSHGTQRLLEGKSNTLTLGPLTREDRGQYFCQARNDQQFQITKMSGDASVTVDVVYLENITLTSDLEINQGDSVTLTCKVDSHPTARLAWTVNGQKMRHVTDNLDRYVIMSAACSDSTNYTCGASNTEMPGRERNATTRVHVNCTQVDQEDGGAVQTSYKVQTEVFATLHFRLPLMTSLVVVHPGGHDVMNVGQDCSFQVTPAFLSRCLQPRCNIEHHHLTFTLTNVTDEDEGDYICLEKGKQKRPIPNCGAKLLVQKSLEDVSQSDHQHTRLSVIAVVPGLVVGVVGILIGIALGANYYKKYRNLRKKNMPTTKQDPKLEFDRLYKKGEVYDFPQLVSQKQETAPDADEETRVQSEPLLGSENVIEYKVKELLKLTLKTFMSKEKLPSFFLNNPLQSKQENILLILDRELGALLIISKSDQILAHRSSLNQVVKRLLGARDKVRRKLQGLVESRHVTAVLALPCQNFDQYDEGIKCINKLRSYPDVVLLLVQDLPHYLPWMERLRTERADKVWRSSSQGGDDPDTAYKMAASSFLTLAGCDGPVESPHSPDPAQSWLLTPAQVKVRDSTARLLHIWGPPGSGKTTLLVHRARQWLADRKAVVLTVGRQYDDMRLIQIDEAVRKGQTEKTIRRLRVCHTNQEVREAVTELEEMFPKMDICICIDALRPGTDIFRKMLSAVRDKYHLYALSTSRKNLHDIDADLAKTAFQLGWKSFQLPDCIRCTKDTVELLNQLKKETYPPISSCSVPRTRDIPKWRAIDHCLHPDHVYTVFRCENCKLELSQALPPLEKDTKCSHWIALHTGNKFITIDFSDLHKALLNLGVLTSDEKNAYLRHEKGSTNPKPSSDPPVLGVSEYASFQERVINGVDTEGRPTVHLVRYDDFRGMEREDVIVVHWDERDNNPEHQSQQDRMTRLDEHRRQWIYAVSCSKGQVVLLLLTPSPARRLLGLPEPVMTQ